jgi:hypothetical protein
MALILIGFWFSDKQAAGQSPRAPVASDPDPAKQASTSHAALPGVDPVVKNWSDFVRVRQPDLLFAWTNDKDHEDAGIETSGGGAYFGTSAVHIIYQEGDFTLTPPPGATHAQTLFAPTTRPPNGACLEMGTAYTAVPGQATTVYLYVFDFCTSPRAFVYTKPVDATFMTYYAGASIAGKPAYTIAIFTQDRSLNAQTKWYAQIFNYKNKMWDTLYTDQGYVSSDYRGWSIFETWYGAGQCSKSLPVLTAASLSYYNVLSSMWEPIAENMNQLQNSVHSGGNCFEDDPHGPASYVVQKLNPVNGWQVISTGN